VDEDFGAHGVSQKIMAESFAEMSAFYQARYFRHDEALQTELNDA
jgi:hypothetical protein